MSETDLYVMGGSLTVIGFMLGVSLLLGFRRPGKIQSEADLTRALAAYEPEARIEQALIDDRGAAALARLADGRMLIARSMGVDMSVRLANPAKARVKRNAEGLIVALGELGFPDLHLRLKDDPPAWVMQFAGRDGVDQGGGEKQ